MKKIVFLFLVTLMPLATGKAFAQDHIVTMDETTNGTVYNLEAGSITIADDNAGANADEYTPGRDYTITIGGGCPAPSRIALRFTKLDISCLDTLYIYDGPDATGNLIAKVNNNYGNISEGDLVFETPDNTTGMVTFRFLTDPLTDTNRTKLNCYRNHMHSKGFQVYVSCRIPCETVVPVIDSLFYRTRNGVVYDSAYLRWVSLYDTVWVNPDDTAAGIDRIDTNTFLGAHLCIGDGVIFRGHGDYTYNYGYYTPNDSTSYFVWDMANEGDTIEGIGVTQVEYVEYQRTDCYDIRLDITDEFGCTNDVYTSVRVRTALNPIKTIFTLDDICNNASLMVNMGYSGENATLTLKEIETSNVYSKTYESVTFIPDGCNCATPSYFEAPVEFTEFPNGSTVTSYKDICSVCINMEHSYMGDIYMTIVCPTGQEALLKKGTSSNCDPDGLNMNQFSGGGLQTGNGMRLGFAIGGCASDVGGYGDNTSDKCSPWLNIPGIGFDYCFSRDTHYTLVTGQRAADVWSMENNDTQHPSDAGGFYLSNTGYTSTYTLTMPTISDTVFYDNYGNPHQFVGHGQSPGTGTLSNVKIPSNHDSLTDYYLPYTTFQELVGCPLNGLWKIRVYDCFNVDNGWIFNWTLDLCDISENQCSYQVGIDSLVWRPNPDSIYHDYELGHYRGAKVDMATPTVSYISTPDTAGTFPIDVFVYDEFGCVWDTNTRITSFWTPKPDLGPDTSLCGVNTMLLDAKDPHALLSTENYTYQWSPFGQGTDTIWTKFEPGTDITYVAIVTNNRNEKVCTRRDTIHVGLRNQPLPSVIPAPFVFEGCAPLTINFENTSVNADYHWWDFGDGIVSTLASPSHTWAEGIYDLKYYATSEDGCVDSIISPAAVSVFSAPKAAFSWDPVYPSVLNPTMHLTNLTTPKTDYTKYFWEIQYNVDNPLSVETFTTEDADFNFSDYTDGEFTGNYAVRLIARTDNMPPSGNIVYCRDTAENTILVVNDFLQFPNVVTPNGDGINDRFVIQNLVNGMGYPINTLDIYNKWGARVYHKENISSDEDFWDPQNLPSGTYFYRFSAKGYNGNIEHNGAIEVIK